MAMLPGSESSISRGVRDTLHQGMEDLGSELRAASNRTQEGGGCTICHSINSNTPSSHTSTGP